MAQAIEVANDQDISSEGPTSRSDASDLDTGVSYDKGLPVARISSDEGVENIRMKRTGRLRRSVPAPWVEYGYSERTYYRRKKLGLLPKRKTK